MASSGKVFATVGTTKFDLLIQTLTNDDVLQELNRKGYKSLTIQCGNGSFTPTNALRQGVELNYYRFKDSIHQDIADADLVISHAGAGTCLEVLECRKKLIVVVNEDLMDNHQIELAEKLFEEGHVLYCTPKNLCQVIQTMDLSRLVSFPPSSAVKIAKLINRTAGFEDTSPLR